MDDDSVLEENLNSVKGIISMKSDVCGDECQKDVLNAEMAVVGDEASQSIPVNIINEEPIDEDRELTTVESSDNRDATMELEIVGITNGGDSKTPQIGMIFKSYEEVVNFYKRYALRIGFGVAVKKSSFTTYGICRRLVLVCTRGGKGRANECYQSRPTAKTNCPAMVVAKLWGDGLLHLMEAHLEHNHAVSPSAARLLKCYKRLPSGMTKDLVVRTRRHENASSDDNEILNYAEGGRLKFGEGDVDALYQFFAHMQANTPNFFYLMDLDVEGHLRNVFWADARSRAAYKYFNDVISFDTSYIKDKYEMPLVLFFGVNHHGQLVLLGCALLSEESTENYFWVLKTWATCMLGSHPNAIIINECRAVEGVNEVFPRSQHRICLWHMLKDIHEKLRGLAEYPEVTKVLEALIYDSSTVDEFEEEWRKLINGYGLEGNEWLNSLYEIRNLWVPVYLKNTLWAGMSISQRNESLNRFFEGFICPETSIRQFLSKYEMFLQSKYEIEAKADFESLHKSRFTVSKFHMEEQISKLYTLDVFRRFQDELKATVYCHVTLVKMVDSISVFKVTECAYVDGSNKTEDRGHEVVYNVDGLQIQCNCNFFPFKGILCRHALSVFKLNQVFEIPSQYVLDRWRKDFKQLRILAHKPKDMIGNNLLERYDNLSMRYLQLVDVGIVSEEKYHLALKLIKDMETSLLDESIFRDLKNRHLVSDNKSNESDELFQLSFFEGTKTASVPPKRRGRPPKKLKESNIEAVSSSIATKGSIGSPWYLSHHDLLKIRGDQHSTEQGHPVALWPFHMIADAHDNAATLLVPGQNDVLHAVSATPHLGSHMRMHEGVDLMEEVNPNELSFANHYGVHANHQHRLSNSTVMQPSTTIQFGQQAVGEQARMQWFYQEMLQEDPDTLRTKDWVRGVPIVYRNDVQSLQEFGGDYIQCQIH